METLLVVGTSVAGVLAGAVLDPVGQRVADASRADEEARLAQAALYESRMSAAESGRFEGPTDEDRPSPTPRLAAHLVPAGPLPARTAVVALVTGALFGAAAYHFGSDLLLAPFCVFFAML
ncbi:MAG TPA: hypothetical protein VKW77_04480, partial [Acidimicrobiales bacterium]|nr:hypothetical protein [Acidimicrobiales bacterium]